MSILDVLEVPSVEEIDVNELAIGDLVAFVAFMENALKVSNERVQEALLDARNKVQQARDRIRDSFPEGAEEIYNPEFVVRKEQRTERQKYLDRFAALKDLIPPKEFAELMFPVGIEGRPNSDQVKYAKDHNIKVHYGVDLRVANRLANKYKGKVKKIIEAASPVVPVGLPVLTIAPRTEGNPFDD